MISSWVSFYMNFIYLPALIQIILLLYSYPNFMAYHLNFSIWIISIIGTVTFLAVWFCRPKADHHQTHWHPTISQPKQVLEHINNYLLLNIVALYHSLFLVFEDPAAEIFCVCPYIFWIFRSWFCPRYLPRFLFPIRISYKNIWVFFYDKFTIAMVSGWESAIW